MSGDAGRDRFRPGATPPVEPPHRVRVPVNVHDWQNISFLHWPVDPGELARRLPDRLTVLTHSGTAWVGVTPFWIRVRLPALPAVRGITAFPETNVRTYVAGPDGREGLWFLRMEVTSAWFAGLLRAIGLPYTRRRMAVERTATTVSYRSRSPDGEPSHDIAVRPGEPADPPSGSPAERFLTARWAAYHRRGPLLLRTPVEHPPWQLHDATAERVEVVPLLRAAGLPPPAGPPLAHFSPGVTVRVGPPERVA